MKKKALIILSYFATAVCTCSLTIFLIQRQIPSMKLVSLENLILERFPNEVDKTYIEDAAANAMVEALGDRWSYYVPASSYEQLEESMNNSYVGIGITLEDAQKTGAFRVLAVAEGGPAQQAGMLPEDEIIRVDGEDVDGLSLDDLSARIKGEAGSQVTLVVNRQGEEVTLVVTRNQVNTVVARGNLINGEIGYVRIENFVARSSEETIGVIDDLISQGATKLIFDVRSNSGGYEEELIKILDYLLPEGTLLSNADKAGEEETFVSDAECIDLPMAVLINEDSYSAAELFAAVLSEYGAAKTVGSHTVGKGYYQNLFRLDDGSAVDLSVGRYFTSKGENLEGVGLTPDVQVEMNDEDYALFYYGMLDQEQDAQLQAAVDLLTENERIKRLPM